MVDDAKSKEEDELATIKRRPRKDAGVQNLAATISQQEEETKQTFTKSQRRVQASTE